MKKCVLIVAEEARLRATLAHAGVLAGCRVELAERVDQARKVVTNGGAALAIVAPAGLGAEGLALARELSETSDALIVVAEEMEAVERLSRAVPGAAGYLCTPMKEAEVLIRIREVLDRQEAGGHPETGGPRNVMGFAGCVLDLAAHEFVNSAGEAVTLTRTEFALLSVLVRHPRTVLTRDRLRREVAGRGAEPYERSIDMLVARLRRKVERNARAPVLIVTVPGVGYKFGAIPDPAMKPATVAPVAAVFGPAQKSEAAQNAPRSAERRQLTVLCCNFADLNTLPSRGDPEELQVVMAAFHGCCTEVIERFGGKVDALLADGVLACFGYPQAHEDEAERGIRAGLELIAAVSSLARAPAIRVGIASGLVVVDDLLGQEAAQKHSAVGEAFVQAEQLQALAAANEVVIAESTYRLAGGRFNYRDLGSAEAKGFAEPVHGWRVMGVSAATSRFEVRRGAGLSPLVGREEELKLLTRRWEQAARGEGQVVALVGEPGVGKSRLVYEFTRSHRTQDWLVLEGASISYGRASVYRPVIDLLKAYFGIEDRDDERLIREKLTGKLLALDEALKPDLVSLLALLEVAVDDAHWGPLDPAKKRRRTLDACKRLLLREAQVQPVTLVFEDLHWVDSETQALLDALVESLPTARLLLLTVYRPAYAHRWGSKTYYTQLRIDPLTGKNADELLRTLLGTHLSVQPLFALLTERTEGNPFYLEESVRTLAETGELQGSRGAYRLSAALTSIRIPATVQSILAARIDRLAPEDKRLLQAAAVIGKDVPHSLLQEVAELPDETLRQCLATLQAGEFLYEKMALPDVEYTFKHVLTQEVAYGSLLQERRKALHARIMESIERIYGDRLTEQVERLAHHALHAEVWNKALIYSRQAGEKALSRSANREAWTHLERAIAVLPHLSQSRATREQAVDLRLAVRTCLTALGEYARVLELALEAETLVHSLDDPRREVLVHCAISIGLIHLGRSAEAVGPGQRALAIAEALRDPMLRVAARHSVGLAYCVLGTYRTAIEFFQRDVGLEPEQIAARLLEPWGAGLFEQGFSRIAYCWSHATAATCYAELGEFDQAMLQAERALKFAQALDNLDLRAAAVHLGSLYVRKGDLQLALDLAQNSRQTYATADLPNRQLQLAGFVGEVFNESGLIDEAITLFETTWQFAEAKGMFAHGMQVLALLGDAYGRAGRINEAIATGQQARDLAHRLGHRGNEARTLYMLGNIHGYGPSPNLNQARDSYKQALTLAHELGMRPLQAQCHLALGELAGKVGNRPEAQEHLTLATQMFREMGIQFWLQKAEAASQLVQRQSRTT